MFNHQHASQGLIYPEQEKTNSTAHLTKNKRFRNNI